MTKMSGFVRPVEGSPLPDAVKSLVYRGVSRWLAMGLQLLRFCRSQARAGRTLHSVATGAVAIVHGKAAW